jgi:hypothetical protein
MVIFLDELPWFDSRKSGFLRALGFFETVVVPTKTSLWLAEQGKRTLDEAENLELLTERQAELYKAKGYSDD